MLTGCNLVSSTLDFSSCVLFAAAATVFYKKSFDINGVPIVASLFALALLVQNTGTPFVTVCIVMVICYVIYTSLTNHGWLSTATKLDVFLPFLFVVLDVRYDVLRQMGFEFAFSRNIKIIAVAVPQFIRKPAWLKAKLQGVRSRLGPIYVFYVTNYVTSITTTGKIFQWSPILAGAALLGCGVAAVVYDTNNSTLVDRNKRSTAMILAFAAIASMLDPEESAEWASPLLAQLSIVTVGKFAMFASILAGIVLFRPDNSTMLDLIGNTMKGLFDCLPENIRPHILPYKTTLAERRYYHGRLMICSIACCVMLTIAECYCGK